MRINASLKFVCRYYIHTYIHTYTHTYTHIIPAHKFRGEGLCVFESMHLCPSKFSIVRDSKYAGFSCKKNSPFEILIRQRRQVSVEKKKWKKALVTAKRQTNKTLVTANGKT